MKVKKKGGRRLGVVEAKKKINPKDSAGAPFTGYKEARRPKRLLHGEKGGEK